MNTPRQFEIVIEPDEADEMEVLLRALSRKLRRAPRDLPSCQVIRRSLDARRGKVRFRYWVEVGEDSVPAEPPALPPCRQSSVVIVGDGPAGLFCAYELARAGVAVTVLERGKQVQPRRRDLRLLNREGQVDVDSNYCFGEGGAGTYSDGKLYTRVKDKAGRRDVLRILVAHGAPARVLTDGRPHIGSNRLPRVVAALRQSLEGVGTQFFFGSRLKGLVTSGSGADRRVSGARIASGKEIEASHLVMATGHSARDVFELLAVNGVRQVAKAFAVGVRIEHPQPLINRIQYGKLAGHPKLPAANYRLAADVQGAGVYSFCMCPGGFIVPAATELEALVVNGMSLSRRDSPYANSGIVVQVEPEDLSRSGYGGFSAGIDFQRELERRAFEAGGGKLCAPASRLTDFLARRASSTLPKSSYQPGLQATDLDELLNLGEIRLADKLRAGLAHFEERLSGFVSEEAVLVGVESRTSAPVRVLRDPKSCEAPDLGGLYPCGEGAGYAGGIMSAALDGMRVARAILEDLQA